MSETPVHQMHAVLLNLKASLSTVNSINLAFRREPMDTKRLELAQVEAEACMRTLLSYFSDQIAAEQNPLSTSTQQTPKSE